MFPIDPVVEHQSCLEPAEGYEEGPDGQVPGKAPVPDDGQGKPGTEEERPCEEEVNPQEVGVCTYR